MPQETNLNTTPYNDDFDVNKGFYKVLFNPSRPVQARELTTLQSILQNQVEQFGKHIFKEGSVVIPGNVRYEAPVSAVEIESDYNGIPISLYFNQLIGKKIQGQTSGVSAEIFYLLDKKDSERNNYTLYIKYLQSGSDFQASTFSDGETLILQDIVNYSNTSIQPGQGFCNTISTNCNSNGSSVSVAEGVYFVRGYFARVLPQTILLDQYNIFPSYKIGFNVIETIVTADEDSSLYDNAQGFFNYAAPGADRFKLELELDKKSIEDASTDNFVEILRVENGTPQFFDKNTQYNLIRDELARRTYDESGDYFVIPFPLYVRDSLNDRILNTGIYYENQFTAQGNIPSEDKMVYQIGPGKAYVGGYDVETISSKFLDVPKARETNTVQNQVLPFNAGSTLIINNVIGAPSVGLGTTGYVSLMDSRLGTNKMVAAGSTIGFARVYDFIPESNYVDNTSRLVLRLFDIQTYTTLTLNSNITISTPAYIEGKSSDASGFLVDSVTNNNQLKLIQVSGKFLENEQILVNGIQNNRLITSITDNSIKDVKSIYSSVGISTFNADVELNKKSYIAPPGTVFKITPNFSGISTVSSGLNNNFNTLVKPGDIISYNNPNFSGDVIYNKVSAVSAGGTFFNIVGITTVSGVCSGALPLTNTEVSNIIKIESYLDSYNDSLMTPLGKNNVANIDLVSTEITQRRTFDNVSFSASSLTITINPTDVDVYFDSFDEDKFVIVYSDGTFEPMRSDKYSLDGTGKILTFNGLTKSSGTAKVIATVKNLKPSHKNKIFNPVKTLVVNKSNLTSSGIGTTTLNDGLTYSNIYGLRVQDREICLNVPDVVRVIGIYESTTNSEPSLPKLQLNSFSGVTNSNQDLLVGETFIGTDSGAAAIIVRLVDSDKVEYVYLNTFQFLEGEQIKTKQSEITANITKNIFGDKNITQNYSLDDGQTQSIYDYSKIVRKNNNTIPTKALKIVFQSYTIDSNDTGEIISANSYSVDRFKHDVPSLVNRRLSDFIDIRPRVAEYSTSQYSPFDFRARNFAADGQYSKYVLAPNENIILSFSYYLPRVDKVLLSPNGTFELAMGLPSENPTAPETKAGTLDIATIHVPPYVYNVKNVNVKIQEHKRYRMQDISLLENRIERVEKYTTLSMLESKAENFTIKDAETGLDRFKCGFFVDNFSTHDYHDLSNPIFNSAIDSANKTLRPKHYTTSLDLQLGSEAISGVGQTFSPTVDQSYVNDLGSPGIKKTGDLITLNYQEKVYIQQSVATRTENVTPFIVFYWQGSIELHPPMDSWIEESFVTTTTANTVTTNVPPQDVPALGGGAIVSSSSRGSASIQTERQAKESQNSPVFTPPSTVNLGVQATQWLTNAQQLLTQIAVGGPRASDGFYTFTTTPSITSSNQLSTWTGNSFIWGDTLHLEYDTYSGSLTQADKDYINQLLPPDVASAYITEIQARKDHAAVLNFSASAYFDGATTGSTVTQQTQTITRNILIPQQVQETITSRTNTSNYTEAVTYLRSRNIEFDVKGLKPVTSFNAFFEGIDVSSYVFPKLLEIRMISGKFQIGETVESDPHFIRGQIKFRVCSPNHKTGPFNAPQETFALIPYTQTLPPSNYSESSTFINVDTRALQLPSEVDYYGIALKDMTIIGKTSGAVAKITNIRLISDSQGRLIGSLFVPNPKTVGNPNWINGKNTFLVSDSKTLDNTKLDLIIANQRTSQSSAQADFTSNATRNVTETNIITTRNVTIIPARTVTEQITQVVDVVVPGVNRPAVDIFSSADPLAQSFYVTPPNGIFVTSIDVFFETKDNDIPVTLQLRPMIAGVPSTVVVPFGEVTLTPDQVNLSLDGTVATRFTFPSPVYLKGPQSQEIRKSPVGSNQTSEYCIVLLSNSSNYRVFISQLGENDILTGARVSQQPTIGSLFKSQNGSVWSPSQLEDLKYTIYRADFEPSGLVRFYNPKLGPKNNKTTITGANQFLSLSRRAVVGLASTGYNSSVIVPGVTIKQNSASAKLFSIAGDILVGAGVTVSDAGIGYTNGTFNNVSLVTETGYGKGATANITISGNVVNTVTIVNGGIGYSVGDSLLVPELGQNVGFGGKVTVTNVNSLNTFVLSDIQGTFTPGISTVSYVNSSGITTTIGVGVTLSSVEPDNYYDGRHLKVYHLNHGMHSSENYVKISDFRPLNTSTNSNLSVQLTATETNTISLNSSSGFELFEGLAVSPSNPGYVIIGKEVITYTTVTGNVLSGLTRGVDGTQAQPYAVGIPVYKYEFNGISLRRINKVHNFAEVDIDNHPIELNSYFIKLETSNIDFDGNVIGTNRPDLYFNTTVQSGEAGTNLSNNIQFEVITPNIANIVPSRTSLTSRIRTYTGTSISGNEKSFIDSGFSPIALNSITYLSSPRLICSTVNEERFINDSPGNRSFTMEFLMNTEDSFVSPVIDTINTSVILTTNLVNSPVNGSYADDDSVRSLYADKHAAIYVSKPIRLEIPANSLKVILSANRTSFNDVRVLYQLYRDDTPDSSKNFELFPGYSNYQIDGQGIKRVIDPSKNDGSSDTFVQEGTITGFKDYQYSVDDLPDFNAFAIKIVMASTSQTNPPLIKDLRAFATIKPRV
jgi:hypothetical protein